MGIELETWPPPGLVELLIKCCCCNISGTRFDGVVLVIAGNLEYVSNLLVLFVCLIFDKSWNICQDLYRSVKISFFKTSIKRRVYIVEHF